MWVKICGVTTENCVRAAIDAGADAIGFVFADSPRRLSIDRARQLSRLVPEAIDRVAVFRHPDPVRVIDVIHRLAPDMVQAEPDAALVDALDGAVRFLPVFHDEPALADQVSQYRSRRKHTGPLLVEGAGRGGRGVRADWNRVATLAVHNPVVLAGGLCPDNVEQAVRAVAPIGVDVSSGVECRLAVKQASLVRRFLDAARRIEKAGPRSLRPSNEVMP